LLTSNIHLDWAAEDTEAANGSEGTQHLWEESWDDDDTSDDFSNQLRYASTQTPSRCIIYYGSLTSHTTLQGGVEEGRGVQEAMRNQLSGRFSKERRIEAMMEFAF
jgi:hypothetical protein